ncbi:MAG: 4-hydroxy-tetrahydrodipicolinate reductase [Bacteroidota bacterium]
MKIALLGYGKMGKEIEQVALQRKHEIVLKIDLHNADSISKEYLQIANVAIEFSDPRSAIANMTKCFDAGIPVVVGTTGWHDNLDDVKKLCKEKNGCLFYASNFSIGVNIFFKVNEHLAKMMNNYSDYDVSIGEIHHIHKLDTPSGTAISLANTITNNLARKKKWINNKTKNTEELEIISKREGEIPGTHIVKYHSAIDDIEIIHTAHNRKGFAVGAVLAAEFVKGRRGIFGMNDLMRNK